MTLYLNTILSPKLFPHPSTLRRSIVIVIDVFRATTTITTALENGAKEIIPALSLQEAEAKAKELRARFGEASVLLCGERDGKKPTGFDLGNSPLEYIRPVVHDKTLVLSTTNGTQALQVASAAPLVIAASFANVKAVARFVMRYLVLNEARVMQTSGTDRDDGTTVQTANHIDSIHAFCAGSEGDFSLEDTLCAGALLEELAGDLTTSEYAFTQSDTAKAARSLYHSAGKIGEALGSTSHAQYLASIGFGADVAFASELGSSRMIPLRRADGSLIHWHNPLNL